MQAKGSEVPSNWQPQRRRARVVAAGTVVLVLAGVGTAWGLTRGSGASYRTAVAGSQTVLETLSATGTVTPVSHADESFQVGGTVAHVLVTTGQHVHAGQVIARLNRSELRSELRSARSTLASARSRMSSDESGQSSGAAAQSSGPTLQDAQPHVVRTPEPSSSGPGSLVKLQAAVRSAQQLTDQALSQASAALKAADEACAASTQSTPSTTPTDSGASPDPTSTPTGAPLPEPSSGDSCTAAGTTLLAAQQAVDRDEQQVADAETALTNALSAASSNSSQPAPSESPSPSQSQSSFTVSAADIALDQASIDQALSTVDTARESLEQATLRAAISGRVAAVTVAHGDQVTASSSSPAFIIVGSRQEQVTVDLSATEIRKVGVGMTAQVVADGSTKELSGRVVTVNAAGVESSSGSAEFPVTIALPRGTSVVGGAAAAVTLIVASVNDVLAVPTSAVHYNGTTAYVDVLRAGKEARRTVTVGAVGAALTQIDSGLTAGDRVVLADLNASVPSSSSNTSSTFGAGGFTFPGGGGAFTRRFAGGGAGQSGTVTFGGPGG